MRLKGLYIIYKIMKGNKMDFDLEMLEKEMDAMTKEMSLEEIAAMEKEIVDGFGQSFDEIFGGSN